MKPTKGPHLNWVLANVVPFQENGQIGNLHLCRFEVLFAWLRQLA